MMRAAIVDSVRTGIGRAFQGHLRATRPDDMAAHCIDALLARNPRVALEWIDDCVIGCAFPEGPQGMNLGRNAAVLSRLHQDTAGLTISRYCASGLDAVAHAAGRIASGQATMLVAGGAESISMTMKSVNATHVLNPAIYARSPQTYLKMSYGVPTVPFWKRAFRSMGETAEVIAHHGKITRAEQDRYAWQSQMRIAAAQERGLMRDEIVPLTATVPVEHDGWNAAGAGAASFGAAGAGAAGATGAASFGATGAGAAGATGAASFGAGGAGAASFGAAGAADAANAHHATGVAVAPVLVDRDECNRPDTTVEVLAGLDPAFRPGGSVTAGNAAPGADGASCMLLATPDVAEREKLDVLGWFKGYATVGCAPELMAEGAVRAIAKLLAAHRMALHEIDLFEINEVFAAQILYCIRTLGLDEARVNVNGGAIGLGHPFGMTGARLVGHAVRELRRRGGGRGVVAMCVGGGIGAAGLVEVS
ncbi:thiolase family protein [Pendulispora albinea]|uniref:acetyl-CoA C-acyltransferase n=1 Tax=Pendulispora albinea TaxID=2741071 RepID=A0ABZ2LXI6_9BACT